MAVYEIATPDGKTFEIDAPDNATEADVMAYARKQFEQPKQQEQPVQTPEQRMAEIDKGGYTLNIAGLDTGLPIPNSYGHFLAGAGKGMVDLVRGAGQMAGFIDQKDEDAYRQEMAPLMTTTGGQIGNVAGQIAATVPAAFVPGVNTYAGAALTGGLFGALQPTGSNESRLVNTAIGTVGGVAGKKVGDSLTGILRGWRPAVAPPATPAAGAAPAGTPLIPGWQPASSIGPMGLNASRADMATRGLDMGFKLTPGQASGSTGLMKLEAMLESKPGTSGVFDAIKRNNQTVVNQSFNKAIGEVEDVVDTRVLEQAHNRITDVFKSVADDVKMPLDNNNVINALADIETRFDLLADVGGNKLVNKLLTIAERGEATGQQLTDISSKMGTMANQNMSSQMGDRQVGLMLLEAKNVVDDLIGQRLSGDKLAQYLDARENYKHLTRALSSPGVLEPAGGDVSGLTLANMLKRKDLHGYTLGKDKSPMYEAARFSKAFAPIVGNSGTATRMKDIPTLTQMLVAAPLNVATRAYTSGPVVRAAIAAGKIPNVPNAVPNATNSIFKYLSAPAGAAAAIQTTK